MQDDDFARLEVLVKAGCEATAVHQSRPMIALTNAITAFVDGAGLSDEQKAAIQTVRDAYTPAAEPATA